MPKFLGIVALFQSSITTTIIISSVVEAKKFVIKHLTIFAVVKNLILVEPDSD